MMRWRFYGPKLAGPRSPYRQGFHRQPLAALLMALESSADTLAPLFFLFSVYCFFILFPWAVGFELMCVVKQSENDLI
jgi:hypothetical protein